MNTIVVVDDDPLVAEVLMHTLLADPGPAICAVTIDEALELLTGGRWRMAIVDVILPGRSGVEIAAEAAAMGTPVLLTTGDFRAAIKLQRYGFGVLQKPVATDVLIAEARMTIAHSATVCQAFQQSAACMQAGEGSLWG